MAIAATGAYTAISKLVTWVTQTSKKFREFQVRMAEVSTILDDIGMKQLPMLTAGVQTLSITFGQATSDMAKGLYDILSAAFDAKDAIGLLNNAVKASIAGLSTVRDSVDILTTILNSYGMAAGESARVSDILFQSVIRGKFQFTELASALQYVIPIAAQAGLKFKEVMAALSTATRHGLRLDMTSRGLALTIQNIVNPTESAQKAAREYGIEMNALALRVLGLHGWFAVLNEKTKEFGDVIIPDLIQNMRSLRVAAVLASDVGLKGFAEDMDLVEKAIGTTNTAMEKMMGTAQFAMNVLTQQLEFLERQIGETWTEFDIWWKKSQVWWGALLSGGDANQAVKDIEEALHNIEIGAHSAFEDITIGDVDLDKVTQYIKNTREATKIGERWLELRQKRVDLLKSEPEWQIGTEGQKLYPFDKKAWDIWNEKIQEVNDSIKDIKQESTELSQEQQLLQGHFDALTGALSEYDRDLATHSDTLKLIKNDIKRLREELEKPIEFGFEGKTIAEAYGAGYSGTLGYQLKLLETQKALADVQYDVQFGLQGVNQGWASNNQELHQAIENVRDYNEYQKETNLEIMKLQLQGMRRRRGLTRGEQRRMDILRANALEERINAQSSMDTIDEIVATHQEMVASISYTYDQQIKDLKEFIESEKEALDNRVKWWDITMKKIAKVISDKMILIRKTMLNPRSLLALMLAGYNVPFALYQTIQLSRRISDMAPYDENEYQRGTHYVPRTGPAIVHRGEQIIPAGSDRANRNNGPVNITVHISADIHDYTGAKNLAARIGELTAMEIENKYRVR
jgi:TP901 family phage tail tape measure protein